jgi:hypothetical protein
VHGLRHAFVLSALSFGCTTPDIRPVSSDLTYEFVAMGPHADTALDVAVVDERDALVARARILLPRAGEGRFPDVQLALDDVRATGSRRLFFFGDSNGDNVQQGAEQRPEEHGWVIDVPGSGNGTFEHTIEIEFIDPQSYTAGADLVLEGPHPDASDEELAVLAPCLAAALSDSVAESFEVRVYRDDDSQVGYFRMLRDNTLPPGLEVRLAGIIESQFAYRLEVLLDGAVALTSVWTTIGGTLTLSSRDWLPPAFGECAP